MADHVHNLIVVYRRRFFAPWRKILVIRCFHCDFREEDPLSGFVYPHGDEREV